LEIKNKLYHKFTNKEDKLYPTCELFPLIVLQFLTTILWPLDNNQRYLPACYLKEKNKQIYQTI